MSLLMQSRLQEDDLRKEGDPKYNHLNDELHVLVEVFCPAAEAHSRMAHALSELKKFLVPDYNDEIRQQQLQELMYLNGDEVTNTVAAPPAPPPPARGRGRGRGMPTPGARGAPRGGALLATPPGRGGPAARGALAVRGAPAARGGRGVPAGRGVPPGRGAGAYEYDDGYSGYEDQGYGYGNQTYDQSYTAEQ